MHIKYILCTYVFGALAYAPAHAGDSSRASVSTGEAIALPVGIERGLDISGHGIMIRSSGGTRANMLVEGLAPNTQYHSPIDGCSRYG